MSRKMKTIEAKVCDLCQSEDCVFHICVVCGKDICYECVKNGNAIETRSSVFFETSSDDKYCRECFTKTVKNPTKRFLATQKILLLKEEYNAFHEDFKKRQDIAELETGWK